MKKIINGKLYDTETATFIEENWWMDTSVNNRQEEDFYVKKTGEFFRHDTKRTTWGSIYNYEKIIPLTLDEAKKQLEQILSVEEYQEVFGKVEE